MPSLTTTPDGCLDSALSVSHDFDRTLLLHCLRHCCVIIWMLFHEGFAVNGDSMY